MAFHSRLMKPCAATRVRDAVSGLRSEIVVNNPPWDKREVGPPVKTIEHIDDRQTMNGGLSIRAQFNGAWAPPAFMHGDVRQSPRGQLTDGRPSIDMIDRLEVDVEGEIKMSRQAVEALWQLSRRQGSGQHVDPIAPDDANRKVAANLEKRLADLLWLAVHFAAVCDSDIRRQKEIRRIRPGYVRPG